METLTLRETRRELSRTERMFTNTHEVLVLCRTKPVARILPAQSKIRGRSLAAFRASQPMQSIPSEVLIRQDRDACD